MEEESKETTVEAGGTGTPEPQGGGTEPKPDAPTAGGGELRDKHGEDAINRGHHERIVKEKDAEIAKLKEQLAEAGKRAEDGQSALAEVEKLREEMADKEVTHALEVAGCVNAKAAKALLGDYSGDVEKLKEACPYLFGPTRQVGATGIKATGAPDGPSDELVAKARQAAGTAYLYK